MDYSMLWWALRQVKSRYWETRRKAAEKLGDSKDPRVVEPLMVLLSDRNLRVRAEAATALGRIGHPMAIEPLVAALKHQYRSVREAAALALGRIGDAAAIEPLIVALEDGNEDVQIAAALALGMIGAKRAVEPLRPVLKDVREDMWAIAVRVLEAVSKSQVGSENGKTGKRENGRTRKRENGKARERENEITAKSSELDASFRKRVLALILSFIYCGVGQVYKGEVLKGISFIMVYTLLIMSFFFTSPFPLLVHLLALTLMWSMGMVDSYVAGRALAERERRWIWRKLPDILRATAISSAVMALLMVALYNIPVTGTESFAIQVAALTELEKAKEVCGGLLSIGYPARIEYPTSKRENLYRVLVGRFHDEQGARSLGEELHDKHGFSYMIVCYRGTERVYILHARPS